jgi:hypothetical protein
MVNLRNQAKETMRDVSSATRAVTEAADWVPMMVLGVAAVSLLALGIALIALEVATSDR